MSKLGDLRMKIPVPLKHVVRPLRDRVVAWWHRYVYPGFARRSKDFDVTMVPEVSMVLITYNRLRMLEECLTSLLKTTRGEDFELIVWDNASTDGTKEYLDELSAANPKLRVIHSPKNVGLNGVARSVALARGHYVIELDDDVVEFPEGWLPQMVMAFKSIPDAGYLAANVVQDERTNGNKSAAENYEAVDYGGVVVEHGLTGGWCTITSVDVLNRVGNFPQRRRRIFFSEDGDFGRRCRGADLKVGILRDVVVYHACGPACNDAYGYLNVCEQKYEDGPEYRAAHSGLQEYAEGQDSTGQRAKRE